MTDERAAGCFGRALSRTAGVSSSALGTVISRVYIEARIKPSARRSCIAWISRRSRSWSPSVSPMSSKLPRSRAASSAPLIKVPAYGVVATVSETKPMVRVMPLRRLTDTLFGRY